MNGRVCRIRRSDAVRALGGEHNATRAEQLRALGNSDRVIARILRVDRDALACWFELQDDLVRHDNLDGAA